MYDRRHTMSRNEAHMIDLCLHALGTYIELNP
jgi:hypothetical protein